MSELLLGEALKIAVEIHGEQRDKSGEPYMGHVCRVMSAMDTDVERCVAILHDTIEDSDSLRARDVAMRIQTIFGLDILKAVVDLTRIRETYMDYIRRLSANPLAVKVKISDLADNMKRGRLRKLPAFEAERLYQRYHEAFCFLTGEQWKHEDAAEDTARDTRFEAQRGVNVTVHKGSVMSISPSALTLDDKTPIIQTTEEISIEEAKDRFVL